MSSGNALLEAPASLNLHRYPDGTLSGVASMRHGVARDGATGGGSGVWARLTSEQREDLNRVRSSRRASQDLRRKIRHADLRRLLTFTNGAPGGWESMREAMLHVVDWYVNGGGCGLLGGSPLAVVAERGEEYGRIHVHAAVRAGGFIGYNAVRASWTEYLTSHGYTSSGEWHRFHAGDENGKHSQGFSSARVCADYMAKYLGKSFASEGRGSWEKRYRVLGVTVPSPCRVDGLRLGDVPGTLRDTFFGRSVECRWYEDADGNYAGWFVEVGPPGGLRPAPGRARDEAG